MKNLNVVLVEESGEEYEKELEGMRVIAPHEELQFESKFENEFRMQGQFCAVAFTTEESHFPQKWIVNSSLEGFDSMENLAEELSEKVIDIIKTRLKKQINLLKKQQENDINRNNRTETSNDSFKVYYRRLH